MESVRTALWSPTSSLATLQARHRSDGPTWVLELSGEADIATWGLVRMVVAQMATVTDECIVVDVGNLAFCDVATAQLIMSSGNGIPVSVTGATGSVERVFDLLDTIQRERMPRFLPPIPPARGLRRRTVSV